ncbi:hypothetical protein A2U01_0038063, partial [Trifolium medium]|nr:hypothetical protein [Trifolium medium]
MATKGFRTHALASANWARRAPQPTGLGALFSLFFPFFPLQSSARVPSYPTPARWPSGQTAAPPRRKPQT